MKSLTCIGAGCAVVAVATAVSALPGLSDTPQPARQGKAVIELFTSQGCSSCPPADRLLGELAEKPGIVALSYSVDYWNYLGWRDTLSSAANSDRQREYARARGGGKVYTPQVVGDGIIHAKCSNADANRHA